MDSRAPRAILYGLVAAFFFTSVYLFNRALVSGGGSWAWAVTLRFLLTLPCLALVVRRLGGLPGELKAHWPVWLLWSAVGFGGCGIGLAWGAANGPAWLTAGCFQTTIVAGPLLAPLIYRDRRGKISWPVLAIGGWILLGIAAMEAGRGERTPGWGDVPGILAVLVAAFSYPLGNRKILLHLERTGTVLTPTQRVFGMTLMSLPLWFLLGAGTWAAQGPPSLREIGLCLGIAFFGGTIATVAFFHATQSVASDPTALAAVEAMQAAELPISAALGALFLGEAWPRGLAAWGAAAVLLGILFFERLSARSAKRL